MELSPVETPTAQVKAKRGRPLKVGKKRPKPLPGYERKGGVKPGSEAVIDLLLENPKLSQRDIAASLNVSLSSAQRYIKQRNLGLPIFRQPTPLAPEKRKPVLARGLPAVPTRRIKRKRRTSRG
jgi:hypothetical protein